MLLSDNFGLIITAAAMCTALLWVYASNAPEWSKHQTNTSLSIRSAHRVNAIIQFPLMILFCNYLGTTGSTRGGIHSARSIRSMMSIINNSFILVQCVDCFHELVKLHACLGLPVRHDKACKHSRAYPYVSRECVKVCHHHSWFYS